MPPGRLSLFAPAMVRVEHTSYNHRGPRGRPYANVAQLRRRRVNLYFLDQEIHAHARPAAHSFDCP